MDVFKWIAGALAGFLAVLCVHGADRCLRPVPLTSEQRALARSARPPDAEPALVLWLPGEIISGETVEVPRAEELAASLKPKRRAVRSLLPSPPKRAAITRSVN